MNNKMYSDEFKWDNNVRNYYQQQQQQHPADEPNYKRRRSGASSSSRNGGGYDAAAADEGRQRHETRAALAAVVQRSGVLGIRKEDNNKSSRANEPSSSTATDRPSSSDSVTLIEDKLLEADKANSLLPTFDQICNFSPAVQCRRFFEDVQPLDRILARIVRPGVSVLHVELVCMLTRFRRNLLAFMKGKLVPVAFDRNKRFYQVNDYVSTTVMAVSPNSMELELQLDEEEAIFTHEGIPAYCRDFNSTTFEGSPHISHLRDNPNLALQLGITINSQHSALPSLCGKHLHLAPPPAQMRREQNNRLAMTHVVRGAQLTRENKCFEAIQCFNKALAVDESCPDAYVGRGAAAAGSRNFVSALQDLDKAIELQPEHRNANKYRLEVLMAYGRDLEKSGNLKEAHEKFERILQIQPGHRQALEAVKRLNAAPEQPAELIDIGDDDDEQEEGGGHKKNGYNRRSRSESMTEEEAKRNREKLNEMEAFIRKLKSGKK